MNKLSTLTITLFAALSVLFLGVAGSSADAGTIYACAHKTNGNMRQVDVPGQCHKTEREIFWDDGSGIREALNSLNARVQFLEDVIGIINTPPSVDAGLSHSILLSTSAPLNGTVTDDGIAAPISIIWEKVNGPGTVIFTDSTMEDTNATFGQIGDYVLSLTASDGLVSVSDETTVTVFPDNTPPIVDAGPDQTITGTLSMFIGEVLTCTTVVTGTVTDDGFPAPLDISWSRASTPRFNPPSVSFVATDTLSTSVTISQGSPASSFGIELKLSANDGFFGVSDTLLFSCLRP